MKLWHLNALRLYRAALLKESSGIKKNRVLGKERIGSNIFKKFSCYLMYIVNP